MAEIAIGVLRGQCLDRRIEDAPTLKAEIAAWEKARNDAKATIAWTFTTEKAREKMGRAYPKPSTPATANALAEPIVAEPTPAQPSVAEPSVAEPTPARTPPESNVSTQVAKSASARRSSQQAKTAKVAKAARKHIAKPKRLRSTFKARPTLPKTRCRRTKAPQPVKITVQSY